MTAPRGFLVAALRSGSGKTTVTLGLLRALARRGIRVAGAKCGPDYIDPAFHEAASGRPSLNLDAWAMPPALLADLAVRSGTGADLVVLEGLMGLFDGVPAAPGRSGSSADVAVALGLPLVLVLDVSGQSQSAAAIVAGVRAYCPELPLAGVVLNRVGSERHARLVGEAVSALGVPVFGAIPRSGEIVMPERHLGLVQATETADLDERIDRMADLVVAHVDLDRLTAAATQLLPRASDGPARALPPPGNRIAVARDEAFTFLYPHLVLGWRAQGSELVFFSPLANEPPPNDCDACWLPGGYPELHAGRLSANTDFAIGLRDFASMRPVHGECGGYMVLGRSLTDATGTEHAMTGLLDVKTSFATRRMHLGYRRAKTSSAGIFGPIGTDLTGHEFHYATVIDRGGDAHFAEARDAQGNSLGPSGSRRGLVSGTFFHAVAICD